MIYETTNFFIDFHAIPFPRKGEVLYGLDSAREISIYNDTIFSISHRGLLYFQEKWIDERFTNSHINTFRTLIYLYEIKIFDKNVFIEPSNDYGRQHSLDKAPWTGLATGDAAASNWAEYLFIEKTFESGFYSKFYPISIKRSESNNLCIKYNCDKKIISSEYCFNLLGSLFTAVTNIKNLLGTRYPAVPNF